MRRERTDDGVSCVASRILVYLAEHPEAKDGLEGILEWWLLEQTIRDEMRVVKAALSELVKKRLVLVEKSGTGPTLYHINREKIGEIREQVGTVPARPYRKRKDKAAPSKRLS